MGNYYSTYSSLPESHYEKVREIKQMFCGKLDNFTIHDSVIKHQTTWDNLNPTFVKKQEITPNKMSTKDCLSFTLPSLSKKILDNANKNTFYSNIRLSTDKYNDIIKSCELEVGESKFESIDSRSFKVLRHMYNLPNMQRSLPFHFCSSGNKFPIVESQKTVIKINLNKDLKGDFPPDFTIKADVYELSEKPEKFNVYNGTEVVSHVITQSDFNGVYKITDQQFKLPIYSRVMTHLMVAVPDNEIEELKLEFTNEKGTKKKILDIPVNQLGKYEDTYIIPLTKNLSFDSIKKYGINFHEDNRHSLVVKLKNKPVKDQHCRVFGLGTNIEVFLNGKYGVRYAK